MHTYVIAEAGSTHDGSLDMALELVQIAKDAGADACKFQYWSSAERLAQRRGAQEYREIYEKYKLSLTDLIGIGDQCRHVGIDFMCTLYLPEDLPVIAPNYGLVKFKIASFEALDTNFILDHVEYGRDIIVSTGMMNAKETHRLLGLRDLIPEIKVLHCVSSYPAPLESLNLRVITQMGLDGFSDHAMMLTTGAMAVAAGAQIIEKHFRHEKTSKENPDYGHSLTLYDLVYYIDKIRDAERAMGDGVKVQQEAEKGMAQYRVV